MGNLLIVAANVFVLLCMCLYLGVITKELRLHSEVLKQIHTMDCSAHYTWKIPPIKAQKGDRK